MTFPSVSARWVTACTVRILLICGASLVDPTGIGAQPLVAGDARFESSQGFTLQPPKGWLVATRAQQQQLAQALRDVNQRLAEGLDSDRMAVVIAEPDGVSNINVVVAPGPLPIDDPDALTQLQTGLEGQYRSMGLRVENLRVERRTFGVNRGLLAEYEADLGGFGVGGPSRMRQWQAVFVAWGRTYIVTCSAPIDSFSKVEPVFAATLASMDFPSTPRAVFRSLPKWVQNALIGGLIGALFPLVPALLRALAAKPDQTAAAAAAAEVPAVIGSESGQTETAKEKGAPDERALS